MSEAAAAPYVVVGAGQAGLQVCDSLRKLGYTGPMLLLGDEAELPYQRPPLSKAYLSGDIEAARLAFRPADYFDKQAIECRVECRVAAIDRERRRLLLADGEEIDYARLALTTGTRVRELSCPGADHEDIFYVRTLADSERLKSRLASARRVAVVGGGFIGLEVAAKAIAMGLDVSVIEALDRLMARALSPMMSAYYADLHRAHGVDLRLGVGVDAITPSPSGLALALGDGSTVETDIVVAGIGVVANEELAAAAGLACSNGIVVDRAARTSDPHIVAAGDCTWHQNGFLEREIRLESVQNAVDQAKIAAASMLDQTADYVAVPWFWSDQYDAKLQIAGVTVPHDAYAVRGNVGDDAFSVFYFQGDSLVGADSINRPADHMACRRLLQHHVPLAPEQAADETFKLMDYARTAVS